MFQKHAIRKECNMCEKILLSWLSSDKGVTRGKITG